METGRTKAVCAQLLLGLVMTLILLLTGVDFGDFFFDYGLEVVDDFKVLFEWILIHLANLVLLLFHISHLFMQFLLETLHLVKVLLCHKLILLKLLTELLHFVVFALNFFKNGFCKVFFHWWVFFKLFIVFLLQVAFLKVLCCSVIIFKSMAATWVARFFILFVIIINAKGYRLNWSTLLSGRIWSKRLSLLWLTDSFDDLLNSILACRASKCL